jgi:hypothetical protein
MAVLYRIRNLFWVQCRPVCIPASIGSLAISTQQLAKPAFSTQQLALSQSEDQKQKAEFARARA